MSNVASVECGSINKYSTEPINLGAKNASQDSEYVSYADAVRGNNPKVRVTEGPTLGGLSRTDHPN